MVASHGSMKWPFASGACWTSSCPGFTLAAGVPEQRPSSRSITMLGGITCMAEKHTLGWLPRSALGFGLAIALYFVSYFPAWSIALRTGRTWPMAWTIYEPIPPEWQTRMLRFWMKVDPRVRVTVNRICPLD